MKVFKKFGAVICTLAAIASMLCLTACGDDNYPVRVGSMTFDESPEKVAVLSSNIADIVDCIGYDIKVSCVSESVTAENLSRKKVCGSSINPDIDVIVGSGAEVVLADDNVSDGAVKALNDKDIKVVQFHYENDLESMATTYKSVGAILEGKKGREKAETACNKLMGQLETYRSCVSKATSAKKLLYISGIENYATVVNTAWYNTVLDYTGMQVFTDKVDTPAISLTDIVKMNPDFVVYDGDTMKDLKKHKMLGKMKFLKDGNSIRIDKEILRLQGASATANVRAILSMVDSDAVTKAEKMFEDGEVMTVAITNTSPATTKPVSTTAKPTATTTVPKTDKNDKKDKTSTTKATQKTTAPSGTEKQSSTNSTTTVTGTTVPATTQASTTVPATTKPSDYPLQSKYKVKYTDDAIRTMVKQKENNYIKAMQKRLHDIGYVAKDNVTGYFGDLTEKSIKDFEKKNGLKVDGKVTKKMLQKLFSADAKKK